MLVYDLLSREYPGWSLRDIQSLSPRERKDWVAFLRWRKHD